MSINVAWPDEIAALGKLLADESMARHTTLGVGGVAQWYFRPSDAEGLAKAMAVIPEDVPILPMGRGSNLLIADEGFAGVVMDLGRLNHLDGRDRKLRAEAGVRMSKLASFCAAEGWSGVEFMATVPGDVGGGVAMNAGAFGQQASDTLQRVEVVRRDGRIESLDTARLDLAYRRCRLPHGSLVVAAHFELQEGEVGAVRRRTREIREQRSASQPLAQANCGSVFKNPPGHHAAALIEQAGLKGLRHGGARISDVHANFIVNEGNARASDVLALIRKSQEEVAARFSVQLEPEVRIVEGQG
ncbi:MAG: UDP-N-acetylmuramate dehydrogenase [Mariprofundaceae bacterium]